MIQTSAATPFALHRNVPRVTSVRGRRPRVALVSATRDVLGGHSVDAGLLAEGLRREGYGVRYVAINPRFPRSLDPLRRVPCARTILNQALYLPSLLGLRDADVVHVFSASYWSFLLAPAPAMLAARSLGKRVILHYHSGEAEDHLGRWGHLVHPFLRLAHEIVVPSQYLDRVFGRHGYCARVIPNIVNTSRFSYRARTPFAPHLVSTRNLEPHYGVGTTIEAFALVHRLCPEARLTIAGTGSEEASLKRQAAKLGDAVRFLGRVEPEDMPGLLDRGDIFVNSSLIDNQPVSILEAFAAGLPVVTTPTGGIDEMVRNGETGVWVRPGDAASMARAIARLLAGPERALALAERARAEVEKYTWSSVRESWRAVYEVSE